MSVRSPASVSALLTVVLLILLAGIMTCLLTYQHREEVLQDQRSKARLLLLIVSPLISISIAPYGHFPTCNTPTRSSRQ